MYSYQYYQKARQDLPYSKQAHKDLKAGVQSQLDFFKDVRRKLADIPESDRYSSRVNTYENERQCNDPRRMHTLSVRAPWEIDGPAPSHYSFLEQQDNSINFNRNYSDVYGRRQRYGPIQDFAKNSKLQIKPKYKKQLDSMNASTNRSVMMESQSQRGFYSQDYLNRSVFNTPKNSNQANFEQYSKTPKAATKSSVFLRAAEYSMSEKQN